MIDRVSARANLALCLSRIVEVISGSALKTYDEYYSRLWRGAKRLFNGGKERNFESTFVRGIDEQLTEAWYKGADEVNVAPEDMTHDDMLILDALIESENNFIGGIAGDIVADRDAGMTAEDFTSKYGSRVELWAQRYVETVNRAKMRFGGKTRLEWQLGATEQHCPICEKLNGIIAWADEWFSSGIQPQNPPNPILSIEVGGVRGCEGWRCDCRLQVTTKRRTPRAIDRLTEIATL